MSKNWNSYLGNPASTLLAISPIKHWPVEKSFEGDLDPPIIHYIFPRNGLELRCDINDNVSALFFDADEFRGFEDTSLGISFSLNRQQVRERLGTPSKSGDMIKDPILGEYGAWDRFARAGYVVHVEYRVDTDRIKMITLMQADLVP